MNLLQVTLTQDYSRLRQLYVPWPQSRNFILSRVERTTDVTEPNGLFSTCFIDAKKRTLIYIADLYVSKAFIDLYETNIQGTLTNAKKRHWHVLFIGGWNSNVAVVPSFVSVLSSWVWSTHKNLKTFMATTMLHLQLRGWWTRSRKNCLVTFSFDQGVTFFLRSNEFWLDLLLHTGASLHH